MHQLKEVDMLSTKMDLLMKKLEDWTNEKKEVMHIHDSRMTCEVCGDNGHSRSNYPKTQEDVNYINNNNKIKDGISNKGQTTKVTFKVKITIISINHP
jgi:hypothetical protein